MKKEVIIINTPGGLHARPAARIAQCCVDRKSLVTLSCNGKSASGNNVLQILSMGVPAGAALTITAEGPDEEEAVQAVLDTLKEIDQAPAGIPLLKIAFFGTKDYDRTYFSELVHDYNCSIRYLESRLTSETAGLANGFDAVCIFVNDDCSRDVIRKLFGCGIRLILLRCAGFNNVDLEAAKEYGITVLRVPAYSPYAVAEHAMAILQEANRRLHKANTRIRDNNFSLSGLLGLDLHNKIAGIIGTGKIGRQMARICTGYGMTVLAWDAYPDAELEKSGLVRYVDKDELFRKADLISLHVPLVMGEGGTWHLINQETIAMMKPTAMLVNTSRGGLIDSEALIDALKDGKFQAVALDVYEGEDANVYTDHSAEPMSNDITARLTMFPQLVLTSHQAFFTREALQKIAATTMENARNFNRGLPYGDTEVKAR